jgi:16S rRNA (cytidine1402-2'-O)-methyltransferase
MKPVEHFRFLYHGTSFAVPRLPAGLYIVSTPIGNLGDITLRGLETLAGCSVIACEDTRNSGILLKRYGVDRPKVSYTEHNADTRGPDLLRQIGEGASIALISDAGTPLVSDPGFRLVRQAADQGLPIIPLPGASAPLAALVASGLTTDDFRFCGFLPNKTQARHRRLEELARETCTLVFFESPNRIGASLRAMSQVFGEGRPAVIGRELTKMHETFYRDTLENLGCQFEQMDKVRGEIVVVLEGARSVAPTQEDIDAQLRDALQTMKTKEAAAHVARTSGRSRQDLYKLALALKDEK